MTKKRKPLKDMEKEELAESLFGKKLKRKLDELAHEKDPKAPAPDQNDETK